MLCRFWKFCSVESFFFFKQKQRIYWKEKELVCFKKQLSFRKLSGVGRPWRQPQLGTQMSLFSFATNWVSSQRVNSGCKFLLTYITQVKPPERGKWLFQTLIQNSFNVIRTATDTQLLPKGMPSKSGIAYGSKEGAWVSSFSEWYLAPPVQADTSLHSPAN